MHLHDLKVTRCGQLEFPLVCIDLVGMKDFAMIIISRHKKDCKKISKVQNNLNTAEILLKGE